jgi:hypothetical protein
VARVLSAETSGKSHDSCLFLTNPSLALSELLHCSKGGSTSARAAYVRAIRASGLDRSQKPQGKEMTMAGNMTIWSRIRGFFSALVQDRAATAPRLEHELRGSHR